MIIVQTSHPVAAESLDYTNHLGAKNDNSRWHPFNERIYDIFPNQQLKVLDLGCAGGGMVADFIADGHLAVGIDGSDYPLKNGLGEWPKYAGTNLFTADIGQWFDVLADIAEPGIPKSVAFDVITAWEVLEHLTEVELLQCLCTIHYLLHAMDGIFVCSINPDPQPHHVTCRSRDWWEGFFFGQGFRFRQDLYERIDPEWVRGARTGEVHSFHFVLEV